MTAGFITCLQTPGKVRAGLAAEVRNRVPARQKSTAKKTFRQEGFLPATYHKHKKLNICASTGSSAASGDRRVQKLRLDQIRRPLQGTRTNDPEKVKQLADSIAEIGLQEPIDVLEVEGQYYGFSGCHRYEAHQQLGKETILCKVRRASKTTLKMHMM
ncbi:probable sulfiredoxin-1 at C-terminar half [Coccomyxa sp. Obi]|nr:probable sulfiredoxin-1 at C-terminar half [Coccomyxa sp. Obi]